MLRNIPKVVEIVSEQEIPSDLEGDFEEAMGIGFFDGSSNVKHDHWAPRAYPVFTVDATGRDILTKKQTHTQNISTMRLTCIIISRKKRHVWHNNIHTSRNSME